MTETASTPGPDRRMRARVGSLISVAVLLAIVIPLAILDLNIPFYGAAGMILVGAGIIHSVERWENPARAKQRWGGPHGAFAVVVAAAGALGVYIILFG